MYWMYYFLNGTKLLYMYIAKLEKETNLKGGLNIYNWIENVTEISIINKKEDFDLIDGVMDSVDLSSVEN